MEVEEMYKFIKSTSPNILAVIDYVEELKKENEELKESLKSKKTQEVAISKADKIKERQARKDLKINPKDLKILYALTRDEDEVGDVTFEEFEIKCKKSYMLYKKLSTWFTNPNYNYSQYINNIIHWETYFPKTKNEKDQEKINKLNLK